MKKLLALSLALLMVMATLFGCISKNNFDTNEYVETSDHGGEEDAKLVSFTDDIGRTVELPKEIKTIGAAGKPAAFVLYNLAPDMLVGWPSGPKGDASAYYLDSVKGISEWGTLFGKKSNLNKEELLSVKPDVLIDFGQVKKDMAADLDAVQNDLNIPIIFIKGDLKDMKSGFEKLGKLLGKETEAAELIAYIEHAEEIAEKSAKLASTSFYVGSGDAGLNTNHAGNVQQAPFEAAGMKNVIALDDRSDRGGNEVSFEEVLNQNPDIIIFEDGSIFDKIKEADGWKNLDAVKNGEVYRAPTVGINWMGHPATTNQILGLIYASYINVQSIMTREEFAKEIVEYYRLFVHYEMTTEQATEIIDSLKIK